MTGTDNVSSNTLLEYLLINPVFDSLILMLAQSDLRAKHGHQAITILTILVQYRKHDSTNPYILNLSILEQELVLHGYSQVSLLLPLRGIYLNSTFWDNELITT